MLGITIADGGQVSVRAAAKTMTFLAPAALRVRAALPEVAPVVTTSSTRSTTRSRTAAGPAAGEGDSRVQEPLTAAAADLRLPQGPPSQRGRQRPPETAGERPGDRFRVVAAASEPPAPVHGHGYDNVGAAQLDSQSSVRRAGDVEAQVVEAAVLQAQDDLVERRVVRPEPEETVAAFQPVSAGRVRGPGVEQPPARLAQPEFPFGRGRAGQAGPGQEQRDGEGEETPRQPADVLRR